MELVHFLAFEELTSSYMTAGQLNPVFFNKVVTPHSRRFTTRLETGFGRFGHVIRMTDNRLPKKI
jgi:hypothetical protein